MNDMTEMTDKTDMTEMTDKTDTFDMSDMEWNYILIIVFSGLYLMEILTVQEMSLLYQETAK